MNLDVLTYAGNLANLADVAELAALPLRARRHPRHEGREGRSSPDADWIVNFAAESHVDRSTKARAGEFIDTNVYGAYVHARGHAPGEPRRALPAGRHRRGLRLRPLAGVPERERAARGRRARTRRRRPAPTTSRSPSTARTTWTCSSRAARTTTGRSSIPEKMIPVFVTNALDGEPLPLYDGGTQVRDWLRVEDHCRALLLLLRRGTDGRDLQHRREPDAGGHQPRAHAHDPRALRTGPRR